MTQNTTFYTGNQHNSPVVNGSSTVVATNERANQIDLPSWNPVIDLDNGHVQMPLQFHAPTEQGTSTEGIDYLTFDEVYSDGLSLNDIGAAGADGASLWQVI